MPTYTAMIEMVPFTVKVEAKYQQGAEEKINKMLTEGFEDIAFEISSNLYCEDIERD